jgi:hypothetical protein
MYLYDDHFHQRIQVSVAASCLSVVTSSLVGPQRGSVEDISSCWKPYARLIRYVIISYEAILHTRNIV